MRCKWIRSSKPPDRVLPGVHDLHPHEVAGPQGNAPQILFLHRLQPGGADRSYGIEVGRLAGLPGQVLGRAREVLALLEGEGAQMVSALGGKPGAPSSVRGAPRMSVRRVDAPIVEQLGLFGSTHPLVERLKALDIDNLTPRQALDELAQMVDEARAGQRNA